MALDSMAIMRHFPLTGSGLGSFETIYPQFQSFVTDRQVDHAHNDYAEFLAETGIPGAVLLIVALWLFGKNAWRNLISTRQFIGWLPLGATVSCCGILFHSFTDFNLHIPANAAWFALCLGVATMPSLPLQELA
jgi:O-antigen ligase